MNPLDQDKEQGMKSSSLDRSRSTAGSAIFGQVSRNEGVWKLRTTTSSHVGVGAVHETRGGGR